MSAVPLLKAETRVLETPIIRNLGLADFLPVYDAMRRFTDARGPGTPDELWVLEHRPVYTVGLGGRTEHLPDASEIPLEHIDRGGQVTYHGPGQAIVYTLVDLARLRLAVRAMVTLIEDAVIDTLAAHGVRAARKPGAPGAYVEHAKVAALGLRVRRGCCYHGVALNVDMDLTPFSAIDPCGYPGLQVTQASALGVVGSAGELGCELASRIASIIGRR
jgi:lipoyl(octanoyl) transferase